MNKIQNFINKNNLQLYKYSYKNKALILDTNKGKYVIKKRRKNNKNELYDYLLSRNFSFFLYPENNINDEYEIYSYIDEVSTLKEEKAINLVNILAELQIRTTTYKEYTLDEIKEIYEYKNQLIDSLLQYYNDLEETFSSRVYPSPYEQLFLNNVSKIYNNLEYSKIMVSEWYKEVTTNKKKRIVLLHNHLSLEHFIDVRDPKIINFDYANYGSPIYDFAYFYKKHYYELDMFSLFKLYQHRYRYTKEELQLFFIEIIIPDKIKFTNNICTNTLLVHNLVTYIDYTRDFILKQQQKQQKENSEKFN